MPGEFHIVEVGQKGEELPLNDSVVRPIICGGQALPSLARKK